VALLIVVLGIVSTQRMATDIFPDVEIPVASVSWGFTGISPEDMERRVLLVSERAYTSSVNDIEHIESQAMVGVGVIKVYFQPRAKIEAAIAQLTSTSQSVLRALPAGMSPPLIIRDSASSVPILQLAVGSDVLPEAQLFDYAQNFIRTQLATVRGAAVSLPFGGKPRQIMVDLDPQALKAKGLSALDVVNANVHGQQSDPLVISRSAVPSHDCWSRTEPAHGGAPWDTATFRGWRSRPAWQ
jgi:multidrug efflux pump subunit AcrB